jgi:hypothetical protein
VLHAGWEGKAAQAQAKPRLRGVALLEHVEQAALHGALEPQTGVERPERAAAACVGARQRHQPGGRVEPAGEKEQKAERH